MRASLHMSKLGWSKIQSKVQSINPESNFYNYLSLNTRKNKQVVVLLPCDQNFWAGHQLWWPYRLTTENADVCVCVCKILGQLTSHGGHAHQNT